MCALFFLSSSASLTRRITSTRRRGKMGRPGRARVRPLPDGGAHVGISWTRAAFVPSGAWHMPGSAGRAPRPSLPVRGHMSGSAGRAPRSSLPVRGTCRDQLDAPRVRPFRCVAHVGISWTRPASVPSSAGAHVGISWTRPAFVPSGAWHMSGSAGRAPRPSRRQGTTGPGDALMVGIPAARLCF